MFKSIEYKLILYILLLIFSVAAATYFILGSEFVYGGFFVIVTLFALYKLYKHYNKFNQNVLFLLNALDNGDYSFHFSETKLSRREKELNRMLNRIKDILGKARKEIIENEKFLSLIVESLSSGIIMLDEKNNVVLTNKATGELLGLPVLAHLGQLDIIDETYPDLFRNLQPGEHTQISILTDREEKRLSLELSRITLKRGAFRIITLHNIGNELEAAELESWIRLIRVMTHEIMNSIAPITSLSETLLFARQDTRDATTIEALETINSTAKGLISFVESYRKFTGVPNPKISDFDILPLTEQIVRLETEAIQTKNIVVEINGQPAMASADKDQLAQVLLNLVKNAIEAIEPDSGGEIKISIQQRNNTVLLEVANNGNPIPPDVLPYIFIPFFTTKDTGTGIGLSVSRYIMRLNGGKLQHLVSSQGWTVFRLTLNTVYQ